MVVVGLVVVVVLVVVEVFVVVEVLVVEDVLVVLVVGTALHLPTRPAPKMDWISLAARARSNSSTSSMSPPQ